MCSPFFFLKGRAEVSFIGLAFVSRQRLPFPSFLNACHAGYIKKIARCTEIFRKFWDILKFLETFWDIYRFLEGFFWEKLGEFPDRFLEHFLGYLCLGLRGFNSL